MDALWFLNFSLAGHWGSFQVWVIRNASNTSKGYYVSMETIGSPGVVDTFNKTSTVCLVFYFVSIFLGPLCPYFPFTEEETGWSKTGKAVWVLWTTDIVTVGSPKGLVGPYLRKKAESSRMGKSSSVHNVKLRKPLSSSLRAQPAFCRRLPDGQNGSCLISLTNHWLELTPQTAGPWFRSWGRPRRELTAGGHQLALPLTAGARLKRRILVSAMHSETSDPGWLGQMQR